MARFQISFFLAIICFTTSRLFAEQVLYSPEFTNWGVWGEFENCSEGVFVKGFQVKKETWVGPTWDDTSLNGIRFYCGAMVDERYVTSSEGSWGKWGNKYTCGDGYVVGFQLRVEKGNLIDADETATNNLRIFCSNHAPGAFIEADGERWGNWTASRICGPDEGVCGIQTQVQPDRGILSEFFGITFFNSFKLD